jgi:DivIVA domain-containing protein
MELDRQSIERRDFPISRRGYDPAAVDAHLRELAGEVEDLERSLDERAGESLGSAAGSQVQSILEAAEATAADIEQQATEQAAATRLSADRDAAQTRSEAVARAQAHVHAVSQATAALLEKVESMDQEVGALVQSLRAGAGRLASDLRAVEVNMGELYDAAAGATGTAGAGSAFAVELDSPAAVGVAGGDVSVAGGDARETEDFAGAALAQPGAAVGTHAQPAVSEPEEPQPETVVPEPIPPRRGAANGSAKPAPAAVSTSARAASDGGDDLDGARLIALNMALNGEPREQADRYLAENFDLSDREKLLDEVYAAIEG